MRHTYSKNRQGTRTRTGTGTATATAKATVDRTMFDSGLFGIISAVQNVFFSHVDDDGVDRVNHCYTPVLLIIFTIVAAMRQFLNPIDCWPEAEIKNDAAMTTFVDQYCWVEGTYFLKRDARMPGPNEERPLKNKYYQWVPIFLLVQACAFQAPCIVWRLVNWKAGINLHLITELANKPSGLDSSTFEKNVSSIGYHIWTVLDLHYYRKFKHNKSRQFLWCCTRVFHHYGGVFLTTFYLCIKLLYCINSLLQIYLLTLFVHETSVFYGWYHLLESLRGANWAENGHFPRVAFCEVDIRKNGAEFVHKYILQCVLPINLIHEKLFIFLWFWYVFLIVITVLNIIIWIHNMLFSRAHLQFVTKFLKLASLQNKRSRYLREKMDRKSSAKFITSYLSSDGVLIFRLLEYNCGFTIAYEVLKVVWLHYLEMSSSNCPSPVSVNHSASLSGGGKAHPYAGTVFANGKNGAEATLLHHGREEDPDISAV